MLVKHLKYQFGDLVMEDADSTEAGKKWDSCGHSFCTESLGGKEWDPDRPLRLSEGKAESRGSRLQITVAETTQWDGVGGEEHP